MSFQTTQICQNKSRIGWQILQSEGQKDREIAELIRQYLKKLGVYCYSTGRKHNSTAFTEKTGMASIVAQQTAEFSKVR